MRKVLLLFVAAVFFLNPSGAAGADGLPVVTTTTDLAAIAKAIGGDRVKVESIAKGFQDPHYVEAKPSFMRLVNQARLLFSVGLQLEIGWLPLLVQGARNPGLVQIDASEGVTVLERPTGPISRAQGDVHPEGNPHYWLDPRNGLVMARTVTQQLKVSSPGDAAYFDQNFKLFESDLSSRRKSWEQRMAQFRGVEIVAYHKQWEYLVHWLGLAVVGYVEDKPGIPPAPQHLATLVRTMQERKVRALLVADFTNLTIPQSVAEKTGARMVVLPASVGGEKGTDSYGDLFDAIVGKLTEALR
jgi:zinc/manganese transport system substrate-binding protein